MSPLFFGVGAAAAWFLLRGEGGAIIARAIQPGQEGAFAEALPLEAKKYSATLIAASRLESVDAFLLAAIMMRESRGGAALVPPGPGGKGDYGHGHGLMQIDDRSFASWLASNAWADPLTNIRKGAQVLKSKRRFFELTGAVPGVSDGKSVVLTKASAGARGVASGKYPDPRPVTGAVLVRAAVAAYNTGEGNVLRSLAAGVDPDVTTANGNYSADVLSRAGGMIATFDKLAPNVA